MNDTKIQQFLGLTVVVVVVYEADTSPMRSLDQAATLLMLHYCWWLIPHNIVLAVDPNEGR